LSHLLDTNVLSELARAKPDPVVLKWLLSADEDRLHVSVLTLGEIRFGIERLAPGRRRSSLRHWLERDVSLRFAGRIVDLDTGIADAWGYMRAAAKRSGIGLPLIDGLLAATAQHLGLTLVTRNIADFSRLAIALADPGDPATPVP